MNKIKLVLFCILFPLLLLLLSYHANVMLLNFNVSQQETYDYVAKNGQLSLNYTSQEISHLDDVKEVMFYEKIFFWIILMGIIILLKLNPAENKVMLNYACVTGLTAIIVLLLLNFNFIFELFHQILFPQGNYSFPISSLLIQTFPLKFWESISKNIFITFLTTNLLILIVLNYSKVINKIKKGGQKSK
jgi:cation transport ATPase